MVPIQLLKAAPKKRRLNIFDASYCTRRGLDPDELFICFKWSSVPPHYTTLSYVIALGLLRVKQHGVKITVYRDSGNRVYTSLYDISRLEPDLSKRRFKGLTLEDRLRLLEATRSKWSEIMRRTLRIHARDKKSIVAILTTNALLTYYPVELRKVIPAHLGKWITPIGKMYTIYITNDIESVLDALRIAGIPVFESETD